MIQDDRKRDDVEGDIDDRLSDLPRNVIDCILKLLPAQDAARTSILSTKWRYNWAMLPYLVLDERFARDSQSFIKTLDTILLQHLGAIVKFHLHVSSENTNIDRWILFVTRNGVKELSLVNDDDNTYKLSACVFNCPTLTFLYLFNCVFKPPTSFVGFQNLTSLLLGRVTFKPTAQLCVISVPLVVRLSVCCCYGTEYLKVISPKLEYLVIYKVHYLLLNCFMNCQNMRVLHVSFEQVSTLKRYERTSLEKLLLSLAPTLEKLHLNSVCIELLSAGTVAPFTFNCLRYLALDMDFSKLTNDSTALQLIKSAPYLSKLNVPGFTCTTEHLKRMKREVSPKS